MVTTYLTSSRLESGRDQLRQTDEQRGLDCAILDDRLHHQPRGRDLGPLLVDQAKAVAGPVIVHTRA